MSIDHVPKQSEPRLQPNGFDPSTWVYLDDLPISPEEVKEVEALCREWRVPRDVRQSLIDGAKLGRYFTGRTLALMHSPRGQVVLMADETYTTPEFTRFMQNLPPELVGKVVIDYVRPAFDEDSIIG